MGLVLPPLRRHRLLRITLETTTYRYKKLVLLCLSIACLELLRDPVQRPPLKPPTRQRSVVLPPETKPPNYQLQSAAGRKILSDSSQLCGFALEQLPIGWRRREAQSRCKIREEEIPRRLLYRRSSYQYTMDQMNIFRIIGDVSHTVSKCILIWAIHSNRSAEGWCPGLYWLHINFESLTALISRCLPDHPTSIRSRLLRQMN